jgi:hypothetical protein
MGLETSFENLSKDSKEYVRRSIDSCKLQLVEKLSLLCGEMICGFVVSMLLFTVLLFVLALVVMSLTVYIGFTLSVLVIVVPLSLLALLVYIYRIPLFVDRMVSRLMALFYDNGDSYE